MRFLLVGLGNRGGMWADILAAHPSARIAGAVDVDPARLAVFAAKHPGVALFGSLAEGIAGAKPEAVLLVTPPDGHLDQTRAIAAAGLPLLAEKPLAATLADAAEIVRVMARARLPLTVGLNFRYLSVTRAIRDLVARNSFGAPGFGQFLYARNRDGKRPGLNKYPLVMHDPMMLEQSIHHLDLMRFAYGREPVEIACRSYNPAWSMYAHDANIACLIGFEGGLEAVYHGTWTGGWNGMRFEWRTDCADGVIIQRELHDDLATARTGDAELTPVPLAPCRAFIDDTRALLDDFLAAVSAGAAPPCDGVDHLRSLALCFAGIEASRTGRTIAMRDFHAANGLEMLS
jgi:predicted dehydrogenase